MLRFRVFHFRIVGVSFLPVFSDRENLGRSGQRETQRGVCSRVHGNRAAPIGYKLSRGKAFFRPVFGTATPSTGTSVASSRNEGKEIGTVAGLMVKFATGFGSAPPATGSSEAGTRGEGTSIGTLARGPCPQMPQWHPRVAKVACGRSSPRRPCPQTPQGHPRVAKGLSIGSLAGLRHGDPQLKHFWGRVACRRKGNRYR